MNQWNLWKNFDSIDEKYGNRNETVKYSLYEKTKIDVENESKKLFKKNLEKFIMNSAPSWIVMSVVARIPWSWECEMMSLILKKMIFMKLLLKILQVSLLKII